MIGKEEAKEKVQELVKRFKEGGKYWDSKPEEDIKFQFIEPLFEALGWGRGDISKEQRVLKARADYILKLGNQEVLVIEAKKTNVSLMEEEGRQAVSYAYHRKIKFAVLTNFKEIRVYHALSNIKAIDRNLLRANNDYFRFYFEDFIEKFDTLWLLSKESFEKGEINKLLSSKDEKINKPIDESILEDLLKIRKHLSTELKSKKNYLTQEKIDEIVQLLIDRLIFIRSVEDRGLEPQNFLLGLDNEVRTQSVKLQLFPYLLQKFDDFNKRYDSRLFEPNLLEKEGSFSDDVLHKVIRALYFGSEDNQARYMFDEIPGDLLGSIYEQYLGTILKGTEKRVKLDSESGKRKKMGIYYTPAYIVDYIVKNTVGEYIKAKKIDEILDVKIVDPACGSGSFLIRAFQEVCDKIEEKLKGGEVGSKFLFKSKENIERLNLGQKIEILRNCIHGVDLDEKAVEIARLNLLLKLLEGEGQDTKKMLLPHLENNIKCGNSLIDDPKISDRAFNWKAQFSDVFKSGGFDVVIGNPPWLMAGYNVKESEIKFMHKKYLSAKGKFDLYYLFLELSPSLLRESGRFGMITPNKFFHTKSASNLRKFLSNSSYLYQIIDFGDEQLFGDAVNYSCIVIMRRNVNKTLFFEKMNAKLVSLEKFYLDSKSIGEEEWNFKGEKLDKLFNKIENSSEQLKNIVERFGTGVQTGADKVFIIDKSNLLIEQEDSFIKVILKGRDVKRYDLSSEPKKFIFPYKIKEDGFVILEEDELKKNKAIYNLLNKEKILLSKRIWFGKTATQLSGEWYGFVYMDKLESFIKPHILTPSLSNKSNFALGSGDLFVTGTAGVTSIIPKSNKINIKVLLALLNSKPINLWIKSHSPVFQGGFYKFSANYLRKIPIKLPSPAQEKRIVDLVNQMLELQKKYHDEKISGGEKERLKQQIDNTDYEIDEEVYKLYGIIEEEKKIIEESLR